VYKAVNITESRGKRGEGIGNEQGCGGSIRTLAGVEK